MLPYYFFGKIHLCSMIFYRFCTGFSPVFAQKSKKIWQFFAIFSLSVSTSYEKFKKKVAQNT